MSCSVTILTRRIIPSLTVNRTATENLLGRKSIVELNYQEGGTVGVIFGDAETEAGSIREIKVDDDGKAFERKRDTNQENWPEEWEPFGSAVDYVSSEEYAILQGTPFVLSVT